jgi:hypothetical protein
MDSLLGHNSKKCFPLRGVSNSGQKEESLRPPLSFCKFSLLSLFPSPSIPLSLSSLSRLLPSAYRSLDGSADQVVCPNDRGYIPRSNQIVSKHGSRATSHIAHLSTSSTTICFLTYFYFRLLVLAVLDKGDDEDGSILGEGIWAWER